MQFPRTGEATSIRGKCYTIIVKCIAILTLLSFTVLASAHASPLQTADELIAALDDPSCMGKEFVIEGLVQSYYRGWSNEWHASVSVGSHQIQIEETYGCDPAVKTISPVQFRCLDKMRFYGRLYKRKGSLKAGYLKAEILIPGNTDNLPEITPRELIESESRPRLLRLRGLVRNAARDDSDPNYAHLELRNESYTAQALIHITVSTPFVAEKYLGAEVSLCGIAANGRDGLRQHLGRRFNVSGLESIKILTPPAGMDSAPDLENLADAMPQIVAASGFFRAEGAVLAVWKDSTLLLQTHSNRIVRVHLASDQPPSIGSGIRVLGLPVTDFYSLNLIHARWRPSSCKSFHRNAPVDLSLATLLQDNCGHPQINVPYYGKVIRCTGTVQYFSAADRKNAFLQLLSDGQLLTVDVSASPEILDIKLEVGSTITVTGVCVINTDNWNTDHVPDPHPQLFLVPSSPADIVILSRPPWWTPERLLTLLGLFAAALLGVIGWNVSLNRRAKAKGRELAAEQLAHVTSELKVNERTRLAVELHDALSQTLTGVSMQIDTAAGFAEGKIPTITKCLSLASRTIDACRMELRNTLWDLRSAALDEPIMDAAIRKTLCQNLAGVDLSVRFNVPRETFSDNTAHAVLKIIRELATNALRHGKATSLKIAGTIDDGKLLFSVRDNGCGFDPDLAPGISQGHFGLQGIAERLERLNGEMKIESSPGKGAKVTVMLPIPRSGE